MAVIYGARVHASTLPETCGTCHEDQDFLNRLNIKFKHPIEVYQRGIHGKATAGGVDQAASCNDCHSTGGTAHRILAPGHVESTINFFNISRTCGSCHTDGALAGNPDPDRLLADLVERAGAGRAPRPEEGGSGRGWRRKRCCSALVLAVDHDRDVSRCKRTTQ